MEDTNRPTFLGIGAPKCGTTWMYEVLRRHPEVFMAHGKELVFFASDKKYALGENWYLSHFAGSKSYRAVGEISVNYILDKTAAFRIYEFNPQIKMILVVRDPVSRAFSHYRWLRQQGKELPCFLDALESVYGVKEGSMYYTNLERFLDLFQKEQILIIDFEDIKRDNYDIQKRIFQFIGVSQDQSYKIGKVGKTIAPRIKSLEKLRRYLHTQSRKHGMPQIITLVKKTGLSNLYRSLNHNPKVDLSLAPEERKKAISIFENDILSFGKFSGVNVESWLN